MESPQQPSEPVWSPASSSSATVDGRCDTPRSTSASVTSVAGSAAGVPPTQSRPERRLSPVRSLPRPSFAMPSRSRRQMGPSEIEKHKEEIIGMYAASTNKAIRNTLQSRYGIKITEKQLKRVLRIWKAYKNDRGIRKATIAREHNRPPKGSRGQRGRRPQNATPKPPKRIERTPSSNDSEDGSDVEEVYRHDRDGDSVILDFDSVPNNQPGLTIPQVQVPAPSSPALSIRASSDPRFQIPVSSPTAPFPRNGDGFSFNTSPLMPMASPILPMASPILPLASPIMSFSSTPPFPSMTPSSPSGTFRNPRDRIAQLFMEAVTRFPGVYKLDRAPDNNHWSVYRRLQNVNEQRLRQGVLIAQQNNDFGLLEETLTTHIVPMYERLDLLAVVGIVATFAALKKKNVIGALLHYLRANIRRVPDRHRANMVAVLNCFRDLLIHHNEDTDLFHEDLQSALRVLPVFIQETLGRRSLVGIHLVFLLNLGDTNEIMREAMADSASNDAMLRLATSYLLAGKLFFTEGPSSPQTRHHVEQCYNIATRIKKMLDNQGIAEDDERKQDLYHYLCRVGMWHVQCLGRQRVQSGYYGAEPAPPVALLEESIAYGERCAEDGPQSPIVIQAVGKLVEMYASIGEFWQAELTNLRLQAVQERRKVNMQASK